MAVLVIPARGGSVRIPRKNVRPFHGKPIIGWSIEAGLGAAHINRVVVSTDCPEIADIAREFGAEIPFMRVAKLADGHTDTISVIRDAVMRLSLPPETPVCCLYPTAPFATSADLDAGLDVLKSSGARFAFPVVDFGLRIERAYRIVGDRVVPVQRDQMSQRSQELEPAYFDAGQFYWAHTHTWLEPNLQIWDGAAPIILPPHKAQDIDTEDDWARAEQIFSLAERY